MVAVRLQNGAIDPFGLGEAAGFVVSHANGELLGKQLAARAGYKYTSRFRTVLRDLCVRGLLQRGPYGYELPRS